MQALHVIVIALLGFSQIPALAKDNFGFPELSTPSSAVSLTVSFVNESLWNGKTIIPEMRCTRLGGIKPASPQLKVANVPVATKNLVVFFANPRARDNHGLVRVSKIDDAQEWLIPAINSQADTKLPKSVTLFDGGTLSGKAYAAPCPTSGSWQYAVTIYALDESDTVIGIGKMDLGWVNL